MHRRTGLACAALLSVSLAAGCYGNGNGQGTGSCSIEVTGAVTANGDCVATGASTPDPNVDSQVFTVNLAASPGIATVNTLQGFAFILGFPTVGTYSSTTSTNQGTFTLTNADGETWSEGNGAGGSFTLTLVGVVEASSSSPTFIPHGSYSALLEPDIGSGATGMVDISATF